LPNHGQHESASNLTRSGLQRRLSSLEQDMAGLQDREQTLNTLLSQLPGMAYRSLNEPLWTMEFVSEGCLALTGYQPADLLHNATVSYAELIHPADRPWVCQRVQDAMQSEQPFQLVYRIRTAAGEEKWVWERGQRMPVLDQEAVLIEGFITDITAFKEIEDALRDSEQRYRALVEGSIQGICVVQEGLIRFANAAAANMLGYTSSTDVVDQPSEALVAPQDHARLQEYQEACQRGEPVPSHYECQVIRRDGRRITLEVLISRIEWNGRQATLATFLDRTEQTRLEDQLRQTQKLEAIGTLAGGIAHDFNNILAPILGYAELSQLDGISLQEIRENCRHILTAAQRARDLVKQILAFSRQSGAVRAPLQLPVILREILKLVRASLPATIEIQTRIDDDVGTVLANATEIHQVVLNLASNAEYAMRDTGGVLEIELASVAVDAAFAQAHPPLQPGPHVRLIVRDTGGGIPPEMQERIFEPFFTTKSVGEGTGMGLAAVHGIVTGHGGTITVESPPEGGATFAIYLPQISTGHKSEHQDTESKPPRGHGRILFVDDEASLVELGREMLEMLGYEVVTQTSSTEALALFRADPEAFDLVITDQTMPSMTGEALTHEIRRLRSDIPIILCTGFSHTMTGEKARALGIGAYLMKPLAIRDLALAVRQVLHQAKEA
jgi:two-component system cell cycle sensor histidine kinase/response regulator CckA